MVNEAIMSSIFSNEDFWNNFIWPLAVIFVTGIGYALRKKIANFLKRKKPIILSINVDKVGNLTINKKEFLSKIRLIKHYIRNKQNEKFTINISPNYKLKGVDKYHKEEYKLRLQKKATEIKEKIEILFYRESDIRLENDLEYAFEVIENIIKQNNSNDTGIVKLDIYRNYNPKIEFSIYLSQDDFTEMCKEQNLTEKEMQQKLSIPTMTSMSIFNKKIFVNYIYPAFIREMYMIKEKHQFDLETKHWDNLMVYEVGLG